MPNDVCYTSSDQNTEEVEMPVEVPEELLHQSYQCADCKIEGIGPLPGTEFNWVKAARYKGGVRRNAYCKRHQTKRAVASNKKARADDEKRQRYNKWMRENANRYAAAGLIYDARYREKHKPEIQARYRAWVELNREKRKASQDAYRERRKVRGARPARQKRRPGEESEQ